MFSTIFQYFSGIHYESLIYMTFLIHDYSFFLLVVSISR